MPAEKETSRSRNVTCNRRSNKPLMEKRRRARINHSLAELKNLIIDACVKKDQSSRSSKLEKADILEMTVRHVQSLHKQQHKVDGNAVELNEEKNVELEQVKFEAGFKECTREVMSFIDSVDGFDSHLRRRLVNHLFHRVSNLPTTDCVPILNGGKKTLESQEKEDACVEQSVNGLRLIPTRFLPTGEIAFIWPFGSTQMNTIGQSTHTGSVSLCNAGSSFIIDKKFSDLKIPKNQSKNLVENVKDDEMWRPW